MALNQTVSNDWRNLTCCLMRLLSLLRGAFSATASARRRSFDHATRRSAGVRAGNRSKDANFPAPEKAEKTGSGTYPIRLGEPLDATGLAATRRLQELTKRRDRLKRQLQAMEGIEDPEEDELEQMMALKDQVLLMERQLSDSQGWIRERKREQMGTQSDSRDARSNALENWAATGNILRDLHFGRVWKEQKTYPSEAGQSMALSRRLLALVVWCSVSFLLAVVWSTVNGELRDVGDSPAMALRNSARLKKGHRPFREAWKRGLRRPRDALPDGPRQSQLNLAWARAKSQKKKPPTKHSKETLAILEDILRDPVLSVELEHYAGYKTPHEIPEDARAAVERSVAQLLGEQALQSISAAPTAPRQLPQLAVCVDRSLSQYDRNDLAVALEALGFATRVTRHGVRLAASQGEPEVEVLLGLAEELLSQKRGGFCPFPVSHLTVAEDWREADQRGQEEVQGGEIRWALDLTQHLATTSGLPSLALRGKSQKGDIVLELVLRHLALRLQDRDAQALARFKAALAGQGGEDSHSLGSKMAISMAKEMLEWSKSGVLGLWLKVDSMMTLSPPDLTLRQPGALATGSWKVMQPKADTSISKRLPLRPVVFSSPCFQLCSRIACPSISDTSKQRRKEVAAIRKEWKLMSPGFGGKSVNLFYSRAGLRNCSILASRWPKLVCFISSKRSVKAPAKDEHSPARRAKDVPNSCIEFQPLELLRSSTGVKCKVQTPARCPGDSAPDEKIHLKHGWPPQASFAKDKPPLWRHEKSDLGQKLWNFVQGSLRRQVAVNLSIPSQPS
eukprot:s32_g33.t1